jgi:hypothetical protein
MNQSRVRHEWFGASALDRDEGFNIELIQEELLRSLADEAYEAARQRELEREIEQVRIIIYQYRT